MSDTRELNLNFYNLKKIKEREQSIGSDYKIVVLSDTHNYYSQLDKSIKKINSNKKETAFVIITGDITNLGILQEYEMALKFFRKLEVPFLVLIGNHDYLTNGDKIFTKLFGARNISFQFKDLKLMLLDNNNWEAEERLPSFSWMSEEFAFPRGTINLVFSHVAPNDPDRFSQDFIERFSETILMSNVKYYVNGHNHGPGDDYFGGANHLTVGSVSKGVYLELQFTENGVTHERVRF